MKIAKYVGDLLFDYECVVIPGLGGFITDDKSVTINEFTHKFKPPFRKVYFNAHLRANDGMLINHVAQEENIEYKIAKTRVDSFVFQCKKALDNGKRINFKNIGYLYNDKDNNIVFHQDSTINYNPDSFGLSSVISHAIQRESDEEKVKKVLKSTIESSDEKQKHIDRKASEKPHDKRIMKRREASKRLSSFSKQVIFLLVVLGFMGLGYVYMRYDAMIYYIDRYAGHMPFFYSSVNDFLTNNINSTPVAKLSRSTASLFPVVLDTEVQEQNIEEHLTNNNNIIFTQPDEEKIIVENTVVKEIPDNDINKPILEKTSENLIVNEPVKSPEKPVNNFNTVARYYIIAGAFTNESNAKKFVNELRNQGHDAQIADTNKYGMFRVAFLSTTNRETAELRLAEIKNKYNPKAWILSKK